MSIQRGYPLREFERTAPSGARIRFAVRVEPEESPSARQWSFYVEPVDPPDPSGEFFYALAREVSPGLVQMDATSNGLPEAYHHCCITCGVIPVIADHLRVTVRSSRTAAHQLREGVGQVEEERSEAADRVWRRLVAEGGARYVADEDRFYYDAPG